jgi:hypothetical protein
MKRNVFAIVILITLNGCFLEREIVREYDYSYKGRFTKYSSYDLARLKDGSMEFAPDTLNVLIEDAINQRMRLFRFRQKDKKPDLLVMYKLYPMNIDFVGAHQPKIEQWIKTMNQNIPYDQVEYKLKRGTLFISFYDTRRNQSIWQGYTSGVFAYGGALEKDRSVNRAVRMIFDQYLFFANNQVNQEVERIN